MVGLDSRPAGFDPECSTSNKRGMAGIQKRVSLMDEPLPREARLVRIHPARYGEYILYLLATDVESWDVSIGSL